MNPRVSQKTASPEDGSIPAGSVLAHNITAIVGCGYCAAFTGAVIVRATGFDPASNLLMWYSPTIWWAGLLLGLILNWRARGYAACTTWISGILLLGLLASDFFWVTRSWDRTRADLFPLWQGEHVQMMSLASSSYFSSGRQSIPSPTHSEQAFRCCSARNTGILRENFARSSCSVAIRGR